MALVLAFPQDLAQMLIQRFKILEEQGRFVWFHRFWFDAKNENKNQKANTRYCGYYPTYSTNGHRCFFR